MAFAKNFVWGAASSAYQTEGSPRADGGGESIWDVFCRRPGAVADGFDGSAAYRRYEEDIACAAQMGLGAYRFSVSWARVDPYGDGRWNGEGFAFYLRMLQACRAAGLEPYVTLYHWELPQALEDAGGWRSRETARAFARYAAEAAAHYDRRQHPDGRQPYRITYYMRINQVPFYLLEHKKQHDEHERLHGIDHED